jgi:hypothetical protein
VFSDLQVAALEAESASAAGVSILTPDEQNLDDKPQLWLLPPTGEISLQPQKRSTAMSLDGDSFTDDLSKNLTTIFRATALSRISQTSNFKPKDFTLEFGLQSAGSDKIVALAAEDTPIVRPYDRLYVDFTNKSGKAADLNVLYVDHDYGISVICQAHLANGESLFQPMADLNESDIGAERIVAIVNESGKELVDLSFLAQPGITRTRGAGDEGLLGALADLGAGQPTRGPTALAARDPKQPRGAVVMVPLEAIEPSGEQPAGEIDISDERPLTGSCTP